MGDTNNGAPEDFLSITLTDGVKIGDHVYKRLTLRPLTAGDTIDAAEAAEKVSLTLQGEPVVMTSPTRATAERIRRNVKLLEREDGEPLNGPLSMAALRTLSDRDYHALGMRSDQIDEAFLKREEPKGGRPPAADPGLSSDGADA